MPPARSTGLSEMASIGRHYHNRFGAATTLCMTIPEVVITSGAINNHKLFWDGRAFLRCNMYDNTGMAATLRPGPRLS
jgi:hypothetical protein